jgi:long-chain acyl-CoA synthetase
MFVDNEEILAKISGHGSLVDWLGAVCGRYGEAPAFTCMGASITYRQIDQLSTEFASYLQNCTELKPGDPVAIHLPNILQFPVAVFGVLKAGLVVVNTNPLYTRDELRHQLSDSQARAIVTMANSAHLLEAVLPHTRIEKVVITELGDLHPWPGGCWVNFRARYIRKIVPRYRIPSATSFLKCLRQGRAQTYHRVFIEQDSLALLQYSGGVTGRPKGVMLTHRNLLANIAQLKAVLAGVTRERKEIAIAPLPLYHAYSFTLNCLTMLELGARVVLIVNSRDTSGFVKELARWPFTIFSGLNTLFVELCQNQEFCSLDFKSLKITISGAMALTRSTETLWTQVTGCPIQEGYGLTECSPVVAVHPPAVKRRNDTAGLPVALTDVRVVGGDGEALHPGEVGELWVRGPQVMRGYWQNPAATAAALTADGWLKTGDMGRMDEEGYLEVIDRKVEVIHTSGFSVYPSELENIIACHPDILECAIVGLPDEQCGEVIKLFAVSRNRRLTVKALRDYCRERLTSYKVPRQVEFRSVLPKTTVGKVLRRRIRDDELQKQARKRRML